MRVGADAFVRRPLPEILMVVAVVAVPFQQAFTVGVGFPLKISEVAVGAAVVAFAFGRARPTFQLRSTVPLALFFTAFAVSSFVCWVQKDPSGVPPPGYSSFGTDLLEYFGYGLLVAAALFLAVVTLGRDGVGKCLRLATRMCAIYCAAELLLWFFGSSDLVHAVNGVVQIGQSLPVDLPRNGPFLEGNYLGFFAGAAAFVCAKYRDRRGVVLCIAMILFSQSTSAIVAVVLAALVAAVLRPTGRVVTSLAVLGMGLMLVLAIFSPATHYVDSQLNKLGVTSSGTAVSSATYSVQGRQTNSAVGFRMGWDSPLTGYGPGRYGIYYQDFLKKSDPPQRFQTRPIANNAYAQIAAEHGIVALGAFIAILGACLVREARRSTPLLMMTVFLVVGANAVPAWTILTMWFALAYLLAGPRVRIAGHVQPEPTPRASLVA